MKYIRTKDGIVIDLEEFINEEKDTPFYKDFIFEEITKDGVLKWTAVGTEQNSIENQRGIRCRFSATLNSEVIKQADTIEELCDEFVVIWKDNTKYFYEDYEELKNNMSEWTQINKNYCAFIYGAIWTDKGLIYVAKMNESGVLELL